MYPSQHLEGLRLPVCVGGGSEGGSNWHVRLILLAWLKKKKNQKKCMIRPRPLSVSTCLYGIPPKLSSNANSLVADENTRDVMDPCQSQCHP